MPDICLQQETMLTNTTYFNAYLLDNPLIKLYIYNLLLLAKYVKRDYLPIITTETSKSFY